MTVEFYDLAQRLYAARSGRPVLRLADTLVVLSATAVFVEAHRDGDTLTATVATATSSARTVTGAARILKTLHHAGARFGLEAPCQVVVADGSVVSLLAGAARTLAGDGDAAVAEASAVIGWWADRLGYPGSAAVVDVLAQSRQRFITAGLPTDERSGAYWRKVFGVGDGVAGLAGWARAVTAGTPAEGLAVMMEEDQYSYGAAGQAFGKGRDWTAPDGAPWAALGLRRRCDAAELFESILLEDRLWRHRAVHTGNVAGGIVAWGDRTRFSVQCSRMDSRLREGAAVRGWAGGIDSYGRALTFVGEVISAEAVDGVLVLTIAGVRADSRPLQGAWVSLMPAAPNASRVKSSLFTYRRLLTGGGSWIASGKPPIRARRDVPLDVLIAAAETD
ncbi:MULTISPECIES: hypothetical protein [Mycolicibacter]|uniref:Uncharacterized protein n=2 Tax=Mycolicibacter TaxID=1073531 RepID=A0ABU5XMD2_9MYCO|nr:MULTISPECIES: hypothetical protein [unclassified Mycolicibacter]MEB3023359.1 hypothetical protein [Mycolicibacter sp. MYC098]MEB3033700.1 hypothetical protein [Mycolicibacter sp. MYC340]